MPGGNGSETLTYTGATQNQVLSDGSATDITYGLASQYGQPSVDSCAADNPINYIDPVGTSWWPSVLEWAGGLGIGGTIGGCISGAAYMGILGVMTGPLDVGAMVGGCMAGGGSGSTGGTVIGGVIGTLTSLF
jgi:hypothetical protein